MKKVHGQNPILLTGTRDATRQSLWTPGYLSFHREFHGQHGLGCCELMVRSPSALHHETNAYLVLLLYCSYNEIPGSSLESN